MNNEFPDENLKPARIISDNWVFCNFSDEAWEVVSIAGIIICPKCGK